MFGSDFQPNPIPYTSPLWHLFPATLIIVWQITNSCQFQAEGKLWHCHYARASDWILRKNHLPFCCPGFISPSASLLRGVECSLYLPKAEEEKKEKEVNTTQSQVRREFTDEFCISTICLEWNELPPSTQTQTLKCDSVSQPVPVCIYSLHPRLRFD